MEKERRDEEIQHLMSVVESSGNKNASTLLKYLLSPDLFEEKEIYGLDIDDLIEAVVFSGIRPAKDTLKSIVPEKAWNEYMSNYIWNYDS